VPASARAQSGQCDHCTANKRSELPPLHAMTPTTAEQRLTVSVLSTCTPVECCSAKSAGSRCLIWVIIPRSSTRLGVVNVTLFFDGIAASATLFWPVPKDEIATAIARCAGCLADRAAIGESIDCGEGRAIHYEWRQHDLLWPLSMG
jgi:hypothetical protein